MHFDITTNDLNNVIKLFLTDLKVVVDNLEKMFDKNSKTN
jgi:hypothetical protein